MLGWLPVVPRRNGLESRRAGSKSWVRLSTRVNLPRPEGKGEEGRVEVRHAIPYGSQELSSHGGDEGMDEATQRRKGRRGGGGGFEIPEDLALN